MRKHLNYLRYVLVHKWYVFLACLRYGIIWQGVVHDWTKFLPSEWIPYVNFFYGDHPPDTGKNGYHHEPGQDLAFDSAWNRHQKRNPHHWQYWVLLRDNGGVDPLPMPDKYLREMLADWIGAGMAQGKPDTKAWYLANRYKMRLHEKTRAWIERELGV